PAERRSVPALPELVLRGSLRLPRAVLALGVLSLGACAAGALLDRAQFMRSWLLAVTLWVGVAAGCLAVLMLHHLTRGAWGLMLRRVLEAAASTLPLLAALFVPL